MQNLRLMDDLIQTNSYMKLGIIQVLTCLLGFILMGTPLMVRSQQTTYLAPSQGWQIDGKANEWLDAAVWDRKSNWRYFAGFDQAYCYVGVAISNPSDQDLIGMTGLTLKWGTKPQKDKGYALGYPMGLAEENRPSNPQQLDAVIFDGAINLWEVVSADQMTSWIHGAQTDSVRAWKSSGLAAKMGRTVEGDWIYEARIPISLLRRAALDQSKISLILETGALGRPDNLRGTDAVGISGGSASNPRQIGSRNDQARQSTFNRYANFTSPVELRLKKIMLPQP